MTVGRDAGRRRSQGVCAIKASPWPLLGRGAHGTGRVGAGRARSSGVGGGARLARDVHVYIQYEGTYLGQGCSNTLTRRSYRSSRPHSTTSSFCFYLDPRACVCVLLYPPACTSWEGRAAGEMRRWVLTTTGHAKASRSPKTLEESQRRLSGRSTMFPLLIVRSRPRSGSRCVPIGVHKYLLLA